MGEVQWIKLSTGTFSTSRKVKQIEHMDSGDTILIIWFKLLCLAGEINDGGAIYLTPEVPYDTAMLADELRRPEDIVAKALDTFERFSMIIRDDMGFIRLSGWEKYQNVDRLAELREYNRLAQQKCREKKRLNAVNDKSMTSQRCQDIEEDKEEDKEKEFHSFVHSAREEEYIEGKVELEGLEGEDAEVYKEELRESLRRKYMGGELGQGIVFISNEQFSELCNQLSLDEIEKYFGIIVDCERKGKRYKKKTHYQAILDMAKKDRKIL